MSITPQKLPVEDYVLLTEEACSKIQDFKARDQLRKEAMGLLHAAKPCRQNLTKGERHAMKTLQADDTRMVLPFDKGKGVVVVDKCDHDTFL